MALSTIKNLIQRARLTTDEEINHLCSSVSNLLSLPEKSAECCGLLRQLFVVLQATSPDAADPSIPVNLLKKMVQTTSQSLQSQKSSGGFGKCTLCEMILSDLFPSEEIDKIMQQLDTYETGSSPRLLSFITGKRSRCLDQMLPDFSRWLQGQELEDQKAGLVALSAINLLHGKLSEQVPLSASNDKIVQWLSSASLLQAPNPHAINPFRKDESSEVTEIDGSVNTNFFTALNLGHYYTDDQFMNIFSFSVLYKWLLAQIEKCKENLSPPSLSDNQGDVALKSESIASILIPKSVDYCFRIIDQSERKVKVQADSEFQTACLQEAVKLLDIICILDHNQTAKVFQEIKRLNNRLVENNSQLPVLIEVLKFFFHHSKAVVHDPQQTFDHFFNTVISGNFKDQGLAYDTVDFLYSNQVDVAQTTDIFTKYFPNLFKILAWHPRVFLQEFGTLLCSMLNWDTSIEAFHLLLDLPCTTAALEVIESAKKSEVSSVPIDVEPSSSIDAYSNPLFRPLFSYITRCESGQGDTINRLASLHSVLRDCMESTRVLVCCQLVPVLLRIWFETVKTCNDPDFVAQLIPVILERSGLIYGIPELIEDTHKVMSCQLLVLCKKFPEIVTAQLDDIVEFLQTTANMAGRVPLYSSLIYVVGEYSSQTFSSACTSDVIGRYYETLEAVTYEFVVQLGSEDASIPKVVSILISAIAKLASRCQDLIPRTIIALTKVAKPQGLFTIPAFAKDMLVNKANSLIAVLKNPDSAALLLNPSVEVCTERWHLDNTSRATVLRAIHRLMNK